MGVRARAERTLNISAMVVTLEVPKLLSGWLNAFAPNMLPMLVTLEVLKWLSGWLNLFANCRVKWRVCDAERGAGREVEERVGTLVAAQAV